MPWFQIGRNSSPLARVFHLRIALHFVLYDGLGQMIGFCISLVLRWPPTFAACVLAAAALAVSSLIKHFVVCH